MVVAINSMLLRRLCFSFPKFHHSPNSSSNSRSYPINPLNFTTPSLTFQRTITVSSHTYLSEDTENSTMDNPRTPPVIPVPHSKTAGRDEVFRSIEASLGSTFSSQPTIPNPNPLIIVISGPSGVGKDAVIKRLRQVREDLHFVVTATSRPKRDGEIDGKDYFFMTKDEFLSMIEKNELLEYALVYGDYKGIPKPQIREYMAKGCDIVLRVDIQGAATLRRILRNSAVFLFLVAESEEALVRRLIDRKTETNEALLVRVASAREELKHLKDFDYVVVNKEGELEKTVELVESVIDAEKARVQQRRADI